MKSLEKKMFIIPDRLYVIRDLLFVSFNLANVPRDMKVTTMNLHVPLVKATAPTNVYVKEITASWSEKGLQKGEIPSFSNMKKILRPSPKQRELVINVTPNVKKWYTKGTHNHGIVIKIDKQSSKYLESNPPFLILDTI